MKLENTEKLENSNGKIQPVFRSPSDGLANKGVPSNTRTSHQSHELGWLAGATALIRVKPA